MAVSAVRAWTIEDLDRMPEDGNSYEVVRGELFVTPLPSVHHEVVIARLTRLLDPYVAANGLGYVFHPHAVIRRKGSQTEPDLYVNAHRGESDWAKTPTPSLVVEVSSRWTWRRDLKEKRAYYLEDVGVPEYWMVDRERRAIRVARPDAGDAVFHSTLSWHPVGATAPLEIEIQQLCA
jgi:Uma2 family endonuclease